MKETITLNDGTHREKRSFRRHFARPEAAPLYNSAYLARSWVGLILKYS